MRLRIILIVFLLLFTVNLVNAQNLIYQIQPDKVSLSVKIPSDTNYRVWHNTNPMKIIIDLDYALADLPVNETFKDVALAAIRASKGPDNIGTRIVMDFNYLMPQFDWYLEGDWLTVEADKVYVHSSIRTISYGVRYGHERRGIQAGPLIINYLEVRYADPLVEIKSILAQDQIFGRELVSDMAIRSQAVAAVNGLFFASDGRPLGLLVIDGRLISEPYANRTPSVLNREW